MKIRTIITTALLLVFHFSVSTSHPNIFKDGIIKGVIVDSTAGTPLPFANITLHNQKDSSLSAVQLPAQMENLYLPMLSREIIISK
jgi:hypothetical protein